MINPTWKEISRPASIIIDNRSYQTDEWFNVSSSIIQAVPRRLHLQPNHPLDITRRIIQRRFPRSEYRVDNHLSPVVSTWQNFDSLGFPIHHPGRNRSDTYYINRNTLLRTHTSAHQKEAFRALLRDRSHDGFLISADVYRRDAIDRQHYPVFHQMEGARLWDRAKVGRSDPDGRDLTQAIQMDLSRLVKHDLEVEDYSPTFHPQQNPLQQEYHSPAEVEAMAAHLKRSLEGVVVEIFSRALSSSSSSSSSISTNGRDYRPPVKVRWMPAYFPFTSPSWELEIWHEGVWIELLGCGVIRQSLLDLDDDQVKKEMRSDQNNHRIGWAFGLGLERIAMLLFSIPDIRLFWSKDPRFLSQFSTAATSPTPDHISRHDHDDHDEIVVRPYKSISKHPACYKDVAFWLPPLSSSSSSSSSSPSSPSSPSSSKSSPSSPSSSSSSSSESSLESEPEFNQQHRELSTTIHENDIMEVVRDIAGDAVEDVFLLDTFFQPLTRRSSRCYRINYRRLDRTLTNRETNALHDRVCAGLVQTLGVELR